MVIFIRLLLPANIVISFPVNSVIFLCYIFRSIHLKEFSESVHNNLIKKFRALYPGAEIPEGRVEISPLGEVREQVSMYDRGKTFPIKGWSGTFKVTGPNGLLSVALECGLGAKNSSCFGCIVRADVEF